MIIVAMPTGDQSSSINGQTPTENAKVLTSVVDDREVDLPLHGLRGVDHFQADD